MDRHGQFHGVAVCAAASAFMMAEQVASGPRESTAGAICVACDGVTDSVTLTSIRALRNGCEAHTRCRFRAQSARTGVRALPISDARGTLT